MEEELLKAGEMRRPRARMPLVGTAVSFSQMAQLFFEGTPEPFLLLTCLLCVPIAEAGLWEGALAGMLVRGFCVCIPEDPCLGEMTLARD